MYLNLVYTTKSLELDLELDLHGHFVEKKVFFRLKGRRHGRVLSGRSGRKNRSHGARPEQREEKKVEVLTNVVRCKKIWKSKSDVVVVVAMP